MSRFAPYRPENHFEVQVRDTAYRRGHDESWNARIYQPRGAGPFPALLDVHGGAWNGGHLSDDDLMNRTLAASGMVVVAIDYRLAPQQ